MALVAAAYNTVSLPYQGAGGGTRNACLAFGAEAKNDSLIKAGTMIGMHQHGIFRGPWSQVKQGKTIKAGFDADAKFDATVTIDLDRHIVTLVVDDATVETALPADLTERGLGVRSQRYAMVVDDGVVKTINVEDAPGKADVSGADNLIKSL